MYTDIKEVRSLNTSIRDGMCAPRVAILEEKHMVSILLYLMDNGGCTKSQLYGSISRGTRMPEKLDILEVAGLIIQDSSIQYRTVRLWLTELGKDVCRELSAIEGMLERRGGGI